MATFIYFFILNVFSFSYTGMAEHKIISEDDLGQTEAYQPQKMATVGIYGHKIFFETLERDTFPIDSIRGKYDNTCFEVCFTQNGSFGGATFCEDFIKFNLQKFGEKHTFVLLTKKKNDEQ